MASLARILRYPVKSLSAEDVGRTVLVPGRGLPGDRRFALALAESPWHGEAHWLPREQLLNLSRFPRLALLDTRVTPDGNRLTIRRRGRVVLNAQLKTQHGRAVISAFFAAFLAGENFGHPLVVEYEGGFGDHPLPLLSLVGAGTLEEITRIGGRQVDEVDLRVNLLAGDIPPRAEQSWIGHHLRVGEATLAVTAPMEGQILPELLRTTFGYGSLGVWVEVIAGGVLIVGDAITVDPP